MNANYEHEQSQFNLMELSLFNYNQRKLKIILENNFISRSVYHKIKNELEKDLIRGSSKKIEDFFKNNVDVPIKDIQPLLNKELFKYNRIIIKLAQQFSKNKTIQNLKIKGEKKDIIQNSINEIQKKYTSVLNDLTENFLNGFQHNIDDILIDTGLIQISELDFLHNGAQHLEIKVLDRKFGEIVVERRYADRKAVNDALDEQTRLYRTTNQNHLIGNILVEQKKITPQIRDDILIIQNRVMEEDWEDILKKVGKSSIEEKEKNALFGTLVVKAKMMNKEKVIEALKTQNRELEKYKKNIAESDEISGEKGDRSKPRWIGDILVDDFGLSKYDRNKIIKKQMEYKIERINLKFGLNISEAQQELFDELEKYFKISYSRDRIIAYVTVLQEVPETMHRDNIILWLYHKNICYGRINKSIQYLLKNKVKPGNKIVLARGDAPIADELLYVFHFDIAAKSTRNILPLIVKKGKKLVTIKRKKGKSGLNVNHCFVSAPITSTFSIIKGKNVIKNGNFFTAECDGLPVLSKNRTLSVSSKIIIDKDIEESFSPLKYDCDFDVKGSILSNVKIFCRKLKAEYLSGMVVSSGDIFIVNKTSGAEVISKGKVILSSVVNSTVISENSINIKCLKKNKASLLNSGIFNSNITTNDSCVIESDITSSVISAKQRIILKKGKLGPNCKFILGDSLEIISLKKKKYELENHVELMMAEIGKLKMASAQVFDKIEKKDILSLENEIKALNRKQRTKEDLDKLGELRKLKVRKEKQYQRSINDYGNTLMAISRNIKIKKTELTDLEKESTFLKKQLSILYNKEKESPELDVRNITVPKGTIVQFPHNQKKLKTECTGFLFREVFNHEKQRYEIKQHRW